MNFSTRMRQLRVESNITTKELADKLKVARTTVSNWENGNRNPDLEMLKRIAKTLDSTTDYLLGMSDVRNPYENRTDKPNNEDSTNNYNNEDNEPITIAAHFEGDEYTDEELEDIEKFKKWVLDKRNM